MSHALFTQLPKRVRAQVDTRLANQIWERVAVRVWIQALTHQVSRWSETQMSTRWQDSVNHEFHA